MTAPDPHPSAPSRPPPPPSFSLSQSSCRLCRALAPASAGEKEGKDPFSRLTHSPAWEERDFGHSPVHTSRCYPGWKVGRGEPPARCEQRQDAPCTYGPFGDVIVGRGQQQLSAGRCGAVAVASSSAFVSPAGLGRLGQGQGSSGLQLQGAAESCGSRERPMAGAGLGRSGLQGRGAGVAPFGGFGLREKGKKAREERRFAGGVGSSRRCRRAGRDGDLSPLLPLPRTVRERCRFCFISESGLTRHLLTGILFWNRLRCCSSRPSLPGPLHPQRLPDPAHRSHL